MVSRQVRERVTVDLRGLAPRLHAHAVARGRTTAAVVRAAVAATLDTDVPLPPSSVSFESIDGRQIKVTVRLSATHALLLASRARRADVAMGTYVASLLDGLPSSPRPMDHGAAIAALVESTQKVAIMSADIHGFIRLIRSANSEGAEKYRAVLMSLSNDLHLHMDAASRLMASMTSSKRRVDVPATVEAIGTGDSK